MSDAIIAPGVATANRRTGLIMAATASVFFAINGTVSKAILLSGIEAVRLTQFRSLGAFVGIALWLAWRRPSALRLRWREVPMLAVYGVVGFAFVQIFYFISIGRLPVGVALLIEYTAPILIALWARFGEKQPLRKRFWAALALAMLGLAMVAQVFDSGADIDGLGVAAGFAAALALALYFILGDRIISTGRRDAISLTCWAFGFASLFLAIAFPWWSFPFGELAGSTALLEGLPAIPIWVLALWLVVLGTILPFTLIIASLSHLTATGSSVVGMLEPVLAAVVAWILLGEVLAGVQIIGGIVVLVGVLLAETSRAGAVRRAADAAAADAP
jgi:drug/metabolite transporter (DMT)-like permease